jgi:hypothetical protein
VSKYLVYGKNFLVEFLLLLALIFWLSLVARVADHLAVAVVQVDSEALPKHYQLLRPTP